MARAREGLGRRAVAVVAALFMIVSAAPMLPPTSADGGGPTPLAVFPYTERAMEGLETHFLTPPPTADDLHALAFAPDGHLALAAGSHNQILSWDPATNESRLLNNGTLGVLYGLAWKDDSSEALAVGTDGGLYRYDASGVTALAPQNTTIWVGVAYFPGLGYLVVGTGGGIFFLNGSQRTLVASPTTEDLLDVAYDPVGDRALAVGAAGTVVSVERTGQTALVASPVVDHLRGVTFESDTGRGLIVGGTGTMLTYASGLVSNETHTNTTGDYWAVAASNSSVPSAVAIHNQTEGWIMFHNSTADQVVSLGRGLTRARAVAIDERDGSALAAGISGTLFRVWPNGTVVNISDAFQPPLFDAAWSPDGAEALMVGSAGIAFHYDRLSDTVTRLSVPNPTSSMTGVSWAPNGSGALITGFNTFWWYDQVTGNFSEPVGSVTMDLTGVAWRPNRTEALVIGTAGYIGLWDGASLTRISSTSLFNTFQGLAWHTDADGTGDFVYVAGSNVVASYTPGQGLTTVTRVGTFFGVGYEGENVWVVGRNTTHFYDASIGIWQTKTLAPLMEGAWLRALASPPGADALLVVGDNTFIGYLNATGVNRFYAGYNAHYFAVDYNPVTGEPLIVGEHLLAFTMREGYFPNLAPRVVLSAPLDGANFTTAQTIAFDASQSFDPDNDPLTFSWWDSASGFLTAGASFGAQLPVGNHTITVFVDDGLGHNVSASVDIVVVEALFTPVPVVSSPDPNVTWRDDQDITFDASLSFDPNAGDTLTFLWRSSLDGVLGNSSVVVRALSAGTHQVTLTLTDSAGLTANSTFTLSVIPGNRAPTLVVASPSEGTLYHANIPITFDARASSDPDSASFTVRWVVDGLEVAQGLILNRTLAEGTHTLLVEASDGSKSASTTLQLTVGAPLNLKPVFESVGPPNGAVLTGQVVFTGTMVDDPAGPVTRVEVQFGQGTEWVAAQGSVSWSVSFDSRTVPNGPFTVSFRAHDAENTVVLTRTYTVDNPFVNTPPSVEVLTPRPGTTVAGLMTLAGTVGDTDGNETTVEWRVANGTWTAAQVTGPTWSATVDLTGLAGGPVTYEIRASDGTDESETVQLTVIVDNPAPAGGFIPGAGPLLALVALAGAGALLARSRAPRR